MAAVVVLWLYKAIKTAGRTINRTILPGSKANFRKSAVRKRKVRTTTSDVPTPWGWGKPAGRVKPLQTDRKWPQRSKQLNSIPWGWPGNDKEIHDHKQYYSRNSGSLHSECIKKDRHKSPATKPGSDKTVNISGRRYKTNWDTLQEQSKLKK